MSLIQAALGRQPLDLLIRRVSLANVLTGEIYPADIGVSDGRIACVEPPGTTPARQARMTIDGRGKVAVPGLIDSHLHIESSMVTPARFAEAVLPHGTTAIAEDPHEIANVLGLEGVRLMYEASAHLPLKVYFLVPTCVPSAVGLETSGGEMGPEAVTEMLGWRRVLGLAEVMDARAVIGEQPRMRRILEAGRTSGKIIEGHNPMLRGRELAAYVAAGVDSDHTLMTPEYMRAKLRLGITAQLQERYMTRNLIAAINRFAADPDVLLVTDDVPPDDLVAHGHLDQVFRRAVELGMPPIEALRSATLKPARRLRLHGQGAIAPGRAADIVLLNDLPTFHVDTVIVDGRILVRQGELEWRAPEETVLEAARGSVRLAPPTPDDFILRAPVFEGEVPVRVIVSHPHGTTTEAGVATVPVQAGQVRLDGRDDLGFIAVFARAGQSDNRSIGLVQGLGPRQGAIASTVAHDAHHLVLFGREPAEMAHAARIVIEADGGLAAVRNRQVLAVVKLPIAGLLSPRPVAEVAAAWRRFAGAAAELGIAHPHLLMRLTTFTLPVSTGLRITDKGLVDAQRRELVDLFFRL